MDNKLNHLAIILDGNGRWAKNKGLPRIKGHYEGSKRVKEVAIHASKKGIKRLTVYAFSTENWKRAEDEVNFIFKLPKIFLDRYLNDLMKNKIKIDYIGDLSIVPKHAQSSILDAMRKTSANNGMTLCFALNYGSQDEIVRACHKISTKVVNQEMSVEDINIDSFAQHLMNDTPVDFLIRTSGEQRISNFLLWQIAYSEIYFTNVLWPDFNEIELDKAIEVYNKRDRRFGGIKNEE